MPIRVAVFDDNTSRLEGLKMLIDGTDNMQCVAAYPDCRDVVRNVVGAKPDVVLMDIDMPHVDGIEGVTLLRRQFPDLCILMQTVFEDNEKIFEAILAGANGYLLKQTTPAKLLLAIEEVIEGGAPMTPVVAKKVLAYCVDKQTTRTPVEFHLSGRELQILRLLVDGYSYKLIGEQCNISIGTVNSHVSHIYEKLHVKNAASAVSLALREGLV